MYSDVLCERNTPSEWWRQSGFVLVLTAMSSVASTSQAAERRPAKRPKYTREESVRSWSSTTPSRREVEERAAQELEAQRRASRQRVLSVWESLEKRYHRDLDDDDIVDLESMTLIQDAGTLRQIKDVPFGSLAAEDASGSEGDDDEEDELAIWNDERHSTDALVQTQEAARKTRLTEEDERDLEEFLRVEHQRRQEEGLSDDQSQPDGFDEGFTEGGTTTDGAFSERQFTDGDERSEDQVTDEEESSASSFRLKSDREAGGEEEESSSDELVAPPASRTAASESAFNQSEPDSEEESSDDELALPSSQGARESYSTTSGAASKAPSYRPTKGLENTQLSTPPRSKSSAFTQASDRSSHNIPRSQSDTRRVNHSPLPKHPPRPIPAKNASSLGKRKRISTPPLSPPVRFVPPKHPESYYQRHGASSSRAADRQSHHSSTGHRYSNSLDTHLTSEYDDFDASSYGYSGRRSPDYSERTSTSERRDEDLRTPDLSQLLFHLKKVNDWVKTHHIPELEDEEPADVNPRPLYTPSKNSNFPTFPGSTSRSFSTPRNAQRHQFRDIGTSSTHSNRSFSSSMGPPPTPVKLFESSPLKGTFSASPSPVKSSSSSRHHHAHSTSMSKLHPLDEDCPTRRKPRRSFNEDAEGYDFSYRSVSTVRDSSPSRRYEHRARNYGTSNTPRRDNSHIIAPLTQSRRY